MPPKKYISPRKRKDIAKEQMAKYRESKITPEKKKQLMEDDRKRHSITRGSESPEKRRKIQVENAKKHALLREKETAEERDTRLNDQRKRTKANKANEDPKEREIRLEKDKEAKRRSRRAIPRSHFVGRRTNEIFDMTQIQLPAFFGPLFDPGTGKPTEHTTRLCEMCHAVLWEGEPNGFCCSNGRVKLDPLFNNGNMELDVFKELWKGEHLLSSRFLKRIRPFNNALSMASMKVARVAPPGGGWTPSVVIKGKVGILMGPLRPTDASLTPPVFCQLYVLPPHADEPEKEVKMRMGKLYLRGKVSDLEKKELKELMELLQRKLHAVNEYVRDFKHVFEVIEEDGSKQVELMIDPEKRPFGEHARKYNMGFKEISVVTEDETPANHAILIKRRGEGNHIQEIHDMHRSADPLRFTLLFPDGADGWRSGIELQESQTKRKKKEPPPNEEGVVVRGTKCTGRMFYGYHMQIRYQVDEDGIEVDHFNPIHWGRELSQEYFCRVYVRIESNDLYWVTRNQRTLRAEKYQKLYDDTHAQDGVNPEDGEQTVREKLGKMVILPPSFLGGPRYMRAQFQDAMAIVRAFGKPNLFITFTCNPKWPEILDSLLPGQQSHDRPDLVARVFRKKLRDFHKEILKDEVFGKVVAQVNVTEFQKRGLPHNHLLVILSADSAIDSPEKVDQIISAELPPNPEDFPKGPQRDQAQRLMDLVLNNMVHTHGASCLDEAGNCRKHFPKPFCEETMWNEDAYYPDYRRRKGKFVIHKGKIITNDMIIPYNAYLLLKFGAHINVECVISVGSVKYVYKYVYKGPDRLMLAVDFDEVANYQNLRSIGSAEACWRLFQFNLCDRSPAVQALRIHLEDEQMMYFLPEDAEAAAEEGPKETELTAFFKYNAANPGTEVKYVDMPMRYTWNQNSSKSWKPRVQRDMIGRVHGVHPTSGDVFYLRLLLHHDQCKGKTSFTDLRTINGQVYSNFKDTCQAIGLLQDDGEWNRALSEAAETGMPFQIRRLFVVILLFCDPENPPALFEKYYSDWTEDFKRRHPQASDELLKALVLLDLEQKLQEKGKDLSNFKLPLVTKEEREEVSKLLDQEIATKDSVALQEEMNFEMEETVEKKEEMEANLNDGQNKFYTEILNRMKSGKGGLFFLNARGGTGKTYLLTTILLAARTFQNEKGVGVGMASSGIAATLFPQGKTFHSRFNAPVQVLDENTTLNIKPNDSVAKVINSSRVIIWDEAPMMNKFLMEAMNRTLKDISKTDAFFGGKLVILAGDFRQILPVVEHGSRAQICATSIRKSKLWKYFNIRELTENMRVGSDKSLQKFDQFLGDMGNGNLPVVMLPDWIQIPKKYVHTIVDKSEKTINDSMEEFVKLIFPNMAYKYQSMEEKDWIRWTSERAILAPKNVEVDNINQKIVQQFPGTEQELFSADATVDPMDGLEYPVEFLNLLTPSGIPPYRLVLKEGVIVMLIRNLNAREGLCNGTRLIVTNISKLLLQCKIATGSRAGEAVFIPRIGLTINEEGPGGLPFSWKRTQFPIRPAFIMTINKSQGQTLKKVGIWLREPCFGHGQLYVASSRVGNPSGLHYAINDSDDGCTRNVVFHEALLGSESRKRKVFADSSAVSSESDSESEPEHIGDVQLEPEYDFVPPDMVWQKEICEKFGLKLVKKSRWEHWSVGQKFKHDSKPTGYRKIMADGNCFFRAISYALTGSQEQYPAIRAMVCDRIEEHGAPILGLDTLEERQAYLDSWGMRANKAWAHENEISAAADMLQLPISVASAYGQNQAWQIYRPGQATDCQFGIFMENVNSDHFDLVTSIAF